MSTNSATIRNTPSLHRLFRPSWDWPYKLLIFFIIFGALRPDRLLPGGRVLLYVPVLITAVLGLRLILSGNWNLKNKQTKLFLAFYGLMIIHLPLARNFGLAKAAVESWFFGMVPIFLIFVHFADTPFRTEKLLRTYVAWNVVTPILGILGQGKVNVPALQDENDFCLFLNILIPFSFFMLQEARQPKKKLFYLGLLVVLLAANIMTFSRGGFVGLAAMGLYCLMYSKHKIKSLVLATVLAIGVLFFAPPQYIEEVKTIGKDSAYQETGQTRIGYWKAGWAMFLDHPIIGVGPHNYNAWLPDYHPSESRMWGRVAHSLYFTLLPEMGLVGTFIFFGMLYYNYKDHRYILRLYNKRESLVEQAALEEHERKKISDSIRTHYFFSLALLGATIAYLVTGTFISVLWYPYFFSLTAFWVMISNACRKIEHSLATPRIDAPEPA